MKILKITPSLICRSGVARLIAGSLAVTAMVLALPTNAGAQLLLNIQLNGDGTAASQQSGAAATGTAGDFWNNVAVTTPGPSNILSQSSGFLMSDGSTLSPVTLTVFNVDGSGVGGNSGTPVDAPILKYFVGNNTFANPGPSIVTIGGLNPGDTYNLYWYATADHQGVGGTFSVNGGATQSTWANNAYGPPTPAFTQGNPGDYVLFSNVVVNGSGQLIVEGTISNEPQYVVFNGFQLEAVPEPTTVAAMVLGLGFLGYRKLSVRRRSQA